MTTRTRLSFRGEAARAVCAKKPGTVGANETRADVFRNARREIMRNLLAVELNLIAFRGWREREPRSAVRWTVPPPLWDQGRPAAAAARRYWAQRPKAARRRTGQGSPGC